MNMIWSIAWKNVWRNKSRSLIVIIAVILGTVAGVFVNGLMVGWVNQRIRSVIYTEMTHIRLRNPEYLKNEELKYSLPAYEKLKDYVAASPEVEAYSSQVNIMAWAQTARGNTGLTVKAIDVDQEKKLSDLYRFVLPGAGTYLDEAGPNAIYISDKTAEQLGLKTFEITAAVGDSLALYDFNQDEIAQLRLLAGSIYRTESLFKKAIVPIIGDDSNRLSQLKRLAVNYNLRKKIALSFVDVHAQSVTQVFRVCGVFKTTNTAFDQRFAYVRQQDITQLAGLESNQYHELSILLKDGSTDKMEAYKTKIAAVFPNLSVMTWKELAPDAGLMDDIMVVYYYIIMGIIFAALAFGIVNTMLMAILERVKEIGMLLAVGMSKKRVFNMIMLETIFLTFIGAFVGMVLGWLLIHITGQVGLDFTAVADGFEAMGWASRVYPDIEMDFFVGISLMVVIVAILSSIIPARKALKLNPTEALRVDM